MAGFFSRRDCKGRKAGMGCKAYIGTSPKGKVNYGDIDATGYCAQCRKALGIAAGQVALGL